MAARKETFELTRDEMQDLAEMAASSVAEDRLKEVEKTLRRVLDCLDESAEWLTVQAAADQASCSESTIRRWMNRDDHPLQSARVDGVVRIRRQDLDAWLERHKA